MDGEQIEKIGKFCLIDVGSTTTKTFLFIKGEDWHYYRSEAPTTVERPFEDVTKGVLFALRRLEEDSGEKLLKDSAPCIPCYSTSSAGGGLAVVVAGLVSDVTTKSAERVALGAGSLILDHIALDDGRTPYKKIEALRALRPDMILLAGGFDGGAIFGPVFLSELINQADLRPKLSPKARLPVIYAGNKDAGQYVEETLGKTFMFHAVPNIRPASKKENLEPARNAIHDLFMEHVMSHAPGYDKYKSWISAPILPTPGAVGKLLSIISDDLQAKILSIDIGGATTDVFTADRGEVFRTVSANLGMSYSILNVVKLGGIGAIKELLDFQIDDEELLNRIGNKYLNPTELPEDIRGIKIECAVASVAVREAVKEHFRVKMGITLSRRGDELSYSALSPRKIKKTELDPGMLLTDYDIIIGSGGILSHSPRFTALLILINALQPTHKIDLAIDNKFIFPHLGVLSESAPELACELFYKFGWTKLGTLIAPSGGCEPGTRVITVEGTTDQNRKIKEIVNFGEIKQLDFERGEEAKLKLKSRKVKLHDRKIYVGADTLKLIIDARGRPLVVKNTPYVTGNYELPSREIEIGKEERIYRGEITIIRKLAVVGEVHVKQGDAVSPDIIVAKCIRMFLRPFFLNIADSLKIPPVQLGNYFHKNIGDEISRDELLAERKTGLFNPLRYRSPVSGTVEKILPDGTVIVREKPEIAGKLHSIRVAKEFSIEPEKIKPYIRCEIGQEVECGQRVAEMLGSEGKMICRSPIRGRIKSINYKYGAIIIESLIEELELNAWLPGEIKEISQYGCTITSMGTIIHGVWGSGGEAYGQLSFEKPLKGNIVFKENVSKDFLLLLESERVAGLITGGLNLRDIQDTHTTYPIVITDGFGNNKVAPDIFNILRPHDSKMVLIDGTTQLRVGVQRPRIILPARNGSG